MHQKLISLRQDIWKQEKVRFASVGVVNTIVDFGILFLMAIAFGVPAFYANVISTSAALTVSYLLNKKAVFRGSGRNMKRQVTLFLLVTLTGLWLLQPLVIVSVEWVMYGLMDEFLPFGISLLIGKICATAVTLVWNYMWYSRVVFRKENT